MKRQLFRLENFKFGVYLVVPILTVVVFSSPTLYETIIKNTQYVVFPRSTPATEGNEDLDEEEEFAGLKRPMDVHIDEETEAKLDEWVSGRESLSYAPFYAI
eukprot:gb/GECG01002798.1/.p1 GENE.gb/GECG01002798.1/~~gb/GECG01002798.1/.p1  ORF type:complete len:102 (+),score=16.18 gb/GECG01002798.1/:1-306(+)